MKIVIVSSYFGNVIGGALNFIIDLYTELEKRGNIVTLLLDDRYRELFSEKNFNIVWFSSVKITAYSPSLSFIKIISKIDADVIHLHGYMSFQTDFGALIGFLRKIPVILTPHGSLLGYDYLYNSCISKLPYRIHDILTLKIPVKISKYVISTSKIEFNDCKKFGIPINKIQLIPLSFSPQSYSYLKEKKINRKKLLFVGRIVPLKNLNILLKSIKIIKKDIPDVEFIIVGDEVSGRLHGDSGHKDQLISLVKLLEIQVNVHFVGWKTGKELFKLYQNSDLFLFASTYENFGLPLLEAASFGIPLVSTNVGVASDLIGNDEGGTIISKLDEKYISEKIIKLLKDKKKYSQASKYLQVNSKKYLIKSIIDNYEKIFLEVTKIE
jgi:glycosyltransferase involved in cell wall biosynthesis